MVRSQEFEWSDPHVYTGTIVSVGVDVESQGWWGTFLCLEVSERTNKDPQLSSQSTLKVQEPYNDSTYVQNSRPVQG